MRTRSYVVSAGTADKASVVQEPRESTDGKDARLGYESDEAASGAIMAPGGEDGGDYDLRVSKWKGDGQEARR